MYSMRIPSRDNVIVRLSLLQRKPHRFHVVSSETPIALGFEISEKELLLQPLLDATDRARDLAGYESFSALRTLVIKQDSIADKQAVGLPVIDGVPVGGHLADRIRTARIERGMLVLRRGGCPEHFGGPGLIITNLLAALADMITQRFEQPQRTQCIHVGGVFGDVERYFDVALGSEVIHLIRTDLIQDVPERGSVS